MKFIIHFEIKPESVFGVPQKNQVVVPSNKEVYSDTYHRKTHKKVAYGTLSEYRKDEDAINLEFKDGDNYLKVYDNFIIVKVIAKTPEEAHLSATRFVTLLLQNLTVSQERLFMAKPLFIESENGTVYNIPQVLNLTSVTTYNLKILKEHLINGIKFLDLSDDRLEKSLQYYEHTLLLFEKRNDITDLFSKNNSLFISSIFLNIWKSITAIVGDPTVRADRYQSRYKTFGISKEIKDDIDKVKKLRDNYDVAHYNLNPASINEVEKNYGFAIKVASTVIKKYRKHLLNKLITNGSS